MGSTEPSALARDGVRGGFVTVAAQVASMLLQFVSLIVLARLLSPADYGTAAIAISLSGLAALMALLGLPMAIVQAQFLGEGAKSWLSIVCVISGVAFGATLILAAHPLAVLYGDARLFLALSLVSLVPMLSGLQGMFRVELIRSLRFLALSVSDVTALAIAVIVSVGMASSGVGYLSVVALVVTQAGFQTVFVVFAARWWPGRPSGWRTEVVPIIRNGLAVFGVAALRDGSRGALVPIVGLNAPQSTVGAFDRANQIGMMQVTLAVDQLQRVVVPVLARIYDDRLRFSEYARKSELAIGIPVAIGLAWIVGSGEQVVSVVLGGQWQQAGAFIQVIAVGALFRVLGLVSIWMTVASGRPSAGLRVTAVTQPVILGATAAAVCLGGAFIGTCVYAVGWVVTWPITVLWSCSAVGASGAAMLRSGLRIVLFVFVPCIIASLLCVRVPLGPPLGICVALAAVLAVGLLSVALVGEFRTVAISVITLLISRGSRNNDRMEPVKNDF
ncbi:oligosaccharide flippase family protein [Gordonia sp. NPDC003376]